MGTAAAIALALKLLTAVEGAVRAGREDIPESVIDDALDEIAQSDSRVTDAIARRRAREG